MSPSWDDESALLAEEPSEYSRRWRPSNDSFPSKLPSLGSCFTHRLALLRPLACSAPHLVFATCASCATVQQTSGCVCVIHTSSISFDLKSRNVASVGRICKRSTFSLATTWNLHLSFEPKYLQTWSCPTLPPSIRIARRFVARGDEIHQVRCGECHRRTYPWVRWAFRSCLWRKLRGLQRCTSFPSPFRSDARDRRASSPQNQGDHTVASKASKAFLRGCPVLRADEGTHLVWGPRHFAGRPVSRHSFIRGIREEQPVQWSNAGRFDALLWNCELANPSRRRDALEPQTLPCIGENPSQFLW